MRGGVSTTSAQYVGIGIGWHRLASVLATGGSIGWHRRHLRTYLGAARLASALLSGALGSCQIGLGTAWKIELRVVETGSSWLGFNPIGAVLEPWITGWGSVVSPIADRAQKKGPGVGSPGPDWALLRSWVSVNVDRDVLALVMGSTGSIAQDAVQTRCPLPCLLGCWAQDLTCTWSLART